MIDVKEEQRKEDDEREKSHGMEDGVILLVKVEPLGLIDSELICRAVQPVAVGSPCPAHSK
jgi:hypothetical protein